VGCAGSVGVVGVGSVGVGCGAPPVTVGSLSVPTGPVRALLRQRDRGAALVGGLGGGPWEQWGQRARRAVACAGVFCAATCLGFEAVADLVTRHHVLRLGGHHLGLCRRPPG